MLIASLVMTGAFRKFLIRRKRRKEQEAMTAKKEMEQQLWDKYSKDQREESKRANEKMEERLTALKVEEDAARATEAMHIRNRRISEAKRNNKTRAVVLQREKNKQLKTMRAKQLADKAEKQRVIQAELDVLKAGGHPAWPPRTARSLCRHCCRAEPVPPAMTMRAPRAADDALEAEVQVHETRRLAAVDAKIGECPQSRPRSVRICTAASLPAAAKVSLPSASLLPCCHCVRACVPACLPIALLAVCRAACYSIDFSKAAFCSSPLCFGFFPHRLSAPLREVDGRARRNDVQAGRRCGEELC